MSSVQKLILFLFFPLAIFSDDSEAIDWTERYYPIANVTELRLSSGLRILLKPFDTGENTVSIRMTAPSGYASFLPEKQLAARIAADVAWQSGFERHSCDALSNLLYDYSIDFSYEVKPSYRYIAAEGAPAHGEKLLNLIACFFEFPKFDPIALKDIAENLESDSSLFQSKSRPFKRSEIQNVKLGDVKTAFKKLFGDSGAFVCVIVGDFSLDKMKENIRKTLCKMQKMDLDQAPLTLEDSSPLSEVSGNSLSQKNRDKSLLRIAFPLSFNPTAANCTLMHLTCQAVQYSLQEIFAQKYPSATAVDVSFEMPLYPSLERQRMIVQLNIPARQNGALELELMKQLASIQKKGVTLAALDKAKKSLQLFDAFWQNEDEYWISWLTDIALFKWDLDESIQFKKTIPSIEIDELNAFIKRLDFIAKK